MKKFKLNLAVISSIVTFLFSACEKNETWEYFSIPTPPSLTQAEMIEQLDIENPDQDDKESNLKSLIPNWWELDYFWCFQNCNSHQIDRVKVNNQYATIYYDEAGVKNLFRTKDNIEINSNNWELIYDTKLTSRYCWIYIYYYYYDYDRGLYYKLLCMAEPMGSSYSYSYFRLYE